MDKRLLYWYCQWQNFWFYHLNFQFAKYQPTNLQVLPLVTYNLQLIYQKRGPTNLQLFHFQSCRFYNPKQPNSTAYRICHPPQKRSEKNESEEKKLKNICCVVLKSREDRTWFTLWGLYSLLAKYVVYIWYSLNRNWITFFLLILIN